MSNETPFIAHDGMIWPVDRPMMCEPAQIIRRMALDMRAIYRDHDTVTEADLLRAGWSQAQVNRYGNRARARMSAQNIDEQIETESLGRALANMSASAVAAAAIVGAVWCACVAGGIA